MREVAALAGRHLREAARRRVVRLLLLFLLLGLVGVALLLPASPGASRALLVGGLLVAGVAALGAAAAAGGLLPADRRAGRLPWLASLRPAPVERRLAAVGAGMVMAAGTGLLVAFVTAALLAVAGLDPGLREARSLPTEGGPLLRVPADGAAARLALDVPAGADGREVELVLHPRLRTVDALGKVQVAWALGEQTGREAVSEGHVLVVPVPAAGGRLEVRHTSRTEDLLVREVHLLGGGRSMAWAALWLGLLLGLAAAALVPVAVACSRVTSGPTAVGLLLALAVLAAARPLLGDLPPGSDVAARVASRVLGAAAALAPDLGGLAPVGAVAAGRAPGADALAGLRPLAGHLLVGLGLVVLALPGRGLAAGGRR